MGTRSDRKPILGVGINDYPFPISCGGVHMKEYTVWKNMIRRVVDSNLDWYDGAELSENFKYFSRYLEHIKSLSGYECFMLGGWALDSDLLLGRKSYTEEGVCFLPEAVNTFLTHNRKKSKRDGLPVGVVSTKSGRFIARAHKVHIGTYSTVAEAEQKYKSYVFWKARDFAILYRDKLDHRAYEKLYNYEY